MTREADDLTACVQALQDIIADPHRAVEIAEKAIAGVVMERMGVVAPVEGRVTVRIPALPEHAKRGWAKWVFRTDPDAAGGFMFEGPFLRLGKPAPLPPGAVVVIAIGPSYVNRALAYIVQNNGELCAEPRRADREDWKELAKMIGGYLRSIREAPLFTPRAWPPLPAAAPAAPAPAASPPAASDPP